MFFQDKTLLSCPKVNLSNVVITDNLISLMTFNEFNKASLKNKANILNFSQIENILIYIFLAIKCQ